MASAAGSEQLSEEFPLSSGEPGEMGLLDQEVVVRTGIERHARQQQGQLQVFNVSGLPHHVVTTQVVAALLQNRVVPSAKLLIS